MTFVAPPRIYGIAAAEVRPLRKTWTLIITVIVMNPTKNTLRVWRQSLPPPAPGASIMEPARKRQAATTVTTATLRVCRDKRDGELREKSLKDVKQVSNQSHNTCTILLDVGVY